MNIIRRRALFAQAELERTHPTTWFYFDGKAHSLRALEKVPMEDVALQAWAKSVAALGAAGLDTRLAARTIQNGTEIVSEQHTLLGDAQRQFLLQGLSQSKARWKFVAQQMTFAPIKVAPLPESMGGTFLNEDAWDGYRFDRNAVMKHIKDNAIENVVVLSGDTHVVTAFDLPIEPSDPTQYNPATGAGSLAVEFSNNGVANAGILGEFLMANNPHLKYADIANQGYLLLDVTAARVQGEYFFTSPAPDVRSATETFARALFVQAGTQRLSTGTTPSTARANAPALAP